MKKNMKIASVVAAALLAVAPVAGTFANQPVSAAVRSQGVTLSQAIDHFNGKHQALANSQNGHKIHYGKVKIMDCIENEEGYRLENWKERLADGQYHFAGTYTIIGIDASSEARTANLLGVTNKRAQILAQVTIPANATSVSGKIFFNFTVNNGKASDSGLGVLFEHDNSTPVKKSKRAKKHVRRVAKKNSRKHARRSRR